MTGWAARHTPFLGWTRRAPGKLRRGPPSAGFATVGIVLVVVGTMALTLFGVGTVSRALDMYDGNIWMWSPANGSASRVNSASGQADTRYTLKDATGHDVTVVQTDQHLLLHDRTAGTVTSIDLVDLSVNSAIAVPSGGGVSIAMWQDVVILNDAAGGIVRRLDPDTLTATGEPLTFTPGLLPGSFDDDGRYWTLSPVDGAAISITARSGSTPLSADRTVVTEPDHNLALTVLDHGAAVLDNTADTLTVINDNTTRTIEIPGLSDATLTPRTTGTTVTIVVPGTRQVVLVDDEGMRSLTVPGSGELGQTLMYSGRLYVTDTSTRNVLTVDRNGTVADRIPTTSATTMEQREGVLVIDQPANPTSYLVDKNHTVKPVTKYSPDATAEPSLGASNEPRKKAPPAPKQVGREKPPVQTASPTPAETGEPERQPQPPATGPDRSQDGAAPQPSEATPTPGPPAVPIPTAPPAPTVQPTPPAPPTPTAGPPIRRASSNDRVPTNVRASFDGANVTVTWDPVTPPTGGTLQHYNIYFCDPDYSSTTCLYRVTTSSTTPSHTITNSWVRIGGPGTFQVTSVIDWAQSTRSEPSPAVEIPADGQEDWGAPAEVSADEVPENVQVVAGENGGMVLTWHAANLPDGQELQGYAIYRCDGNGSNCAPLFSHQTGVNMTTISPETARGADNNGDTVSFRVASVNTDDVESDVSEASNPITIA